MDSIGIEASRAAYLAAARKAKADRKASRQAKAALSGKADKASRKSASVIVSDMSDNRAEHSRADKQADLPRHQRADYGTAPKTATRGRPIVWTAELKEQWQAALCLWLIDGKSLSAFVRDNPNGPSRSEFFAWLSSEPIFADRYARARECGADALADSIVMLADDALQTDSNVKVNAARLAVDARKWIASKLRPSAYADKLETTVHHSGQVNVQVTDSQRALALAAFMRRQAIADSTDMPSAMKTIEALPVVALPGVSNGG
jgi:hypothetical protein